ncbi:MAG: hypothetical protein [Inoviridae sp.]|nr:MAG: hypothetical protein [Inoviridae sp.]
MPLSSYPGKQTKTEENSGRAPFIVYSIFLAHPKNKRWWSCGTELLPQDDPVAHFKAQCIERGQPVPDAVICFRTSFYD